MANTAQPWRRVASSRRRRGGLASLSVLILAAAMLLLATPKARAADISCAYDSETDPRCQISTTYVKRAFTLPQLGGWYSSAGTQFMEGRAVGKARLTGTIRGDGTTFFAVDVVLEGRLDGTAVGDSGACLIVGLYPECLDMSTWHVYTSLSGTLTGLSGTIDGVDVAGAVYNLSLPLSSPTSCELGSTANPVAQVGLGANTNNVYAGVFANINFGLADPAAFPSLPAGPFAGEMELWIPQINKDPTLPRDDEDALPQGCFPIPSPNLTGTWDGSIDCAGIADFTDVESFSGPVVLKVGAQAGLNYPVLLYDVSDPANLIAAYCAEFAHDLRLNSNQGTGRMTNPYPDPATAAVFLKVRKDPSDSDATLKARELILIPDGTDVDGAPDGMNLCKWTFTQRDTALPDPAVAFVCP